MLSRGVVAASIMGVEGAPVLVVKVFVVSLVGGTFVEPGGKGFGGKTLLTNNGQEKSSRKQTTKTMIDFRSMKI